jgi:hypothetical protein
MDIFSPAPTNGESSLGLPSNLEELAHTNVLPQLAPAPQSAPTSPGQVAAAIRPAGDPYEAKIAEAVAFMAVNYWSQGKMVGELVNHWNRCYESLLSGATTAAEVSRASRLADYAFVVALSRMNRKVPG